MVGIDVGRGVVVVTATRAAFALLLACAACSTTEGNVLTTVSGDGGNGGGDGGGDGDGGAGIDAMDPCAADGVCTPPMPGDTTLCGRVLDIETSAAIGSGAAEIPRVRIFDPLEFAINPTGADAIAEVAPDECGWFSVTIDALFGFTVVHTGNEEITASAPFVNVATNVSAGAGQIVRINAYALRDEVDTQWSTSAGLAGTFSDGGAFVMMYIDLEADAVVSPFQGAPVTGVTIDVTIGGGVDYYFADDGAITRSSIDTNATSTLTSGAGILLQPPSLSSIGGDHPSCTFSDITALALPGLIQVQELDGSCNPP